MRRNIPIPNFFEKLVFRHGPGSGRRLGIALVGWLVVLAAGLFHQAQVQAQPPPVLPSVVDPNLGVRIAVDGLTMPVGMAFLGPNDLLVLEKSTGRVKRVRVVNGAVQVSVVLDLAVNFASERGLLSIALHPDFPRDRGVYLYWTNPAPLPPAGNPFIPSVERGPEQPVLDPPNGPSQDTSATPAVPLLGNRVDRFEWNGSTLTHDSNVIMLRSFQSDGAPLPPDQNDGSQGPAGNHNGGVIRFGPDKKLYIFFGDQGRRGWMQNLLLGPTPPSDDDQFGGPDPDNAHLSGVMLRLNDDGSAPKSNPFFKIGETLRRLGFRQVGTNLQKVFSYGHRNGFGHDFDPETDDLWIQENADDAFSEINRVTAGMNGGWIQIMGPLARYQDFRTIEQTMFNGMLQQARWLPANLAPNAIQAFSRLFLLPGAHYSDPEFSWKFEVAPAGFTFLRSRALGREYEHNLFVGAARTFLANGYLFRFKLSRNRRQIAVDDPRLLDRVADNLEKHDGTESESLLFGRDFGVGTQLLTGPNGNLYVVSLSNGIIYEIFRREPIGPTPKGEKGGHGKGKGKD